MLSFCRCGDCGLVRWLGGALHWRGGPSFGCLGGWLTLGPPTARVAHRASGPTSCTVCLLSGKPTILRRLDLPCGPSASGRCRPAPSAFTRSRAPSLWGARVSQRGQRFAAERPPGVQGSTLPGESGGLDAVNRAERVRGRGEIVKSIDRSERETLQQSIDRSERESLAALHNVQDVTFTVMVRINPRPPSGRPHRSIDAAHPKRPLSRVPEGGTWWLGRRPHTGQSLSAPLALGSVPAPQQANPSCAGVASTSILIFCEHTQPRSAPLNWHGVDRGQSTEG